MGDILENENTVDVVLAGNDALAAGAIQALQEHNKAGEVLVAGQDADIGAIRNIILGHQTVTIYKPIESLAYNAAEAAIKIAKGKKLEGTMSCTVNNGHRLVPSVLLKAQLVNKQNIKMTVVSEGFVEEKEIFE